MQWIDPDYELPPIGSLVIIAIGTEQNKITDYKLANVSHSGAFEIHAYPQSNRLYSDKSPHRTNNAYRVIAYAVFGLCDVNEIIEIRG